MQVSEKANLQFFYNNSLKLLRILLVSFLIQTMIWNQMFQNMHVLTGKCYFYLKYILWKREQIMPQERPGKM